MPADAVVVRLMSSSSFLIKSKAHSTKEFTCGTVSLVKGLQLVML